MIDSPDRSAGRRRRTPRKPDVRFVAAEKSRAELQPKYRRYRWCVFSSCHRVCVRYAETHQMRLCVCVCVLNTSKLYLRSLYAVVVLAPPTPPAVQTSSSRFKNDLLKLKSCLVNISLFKSEEAAPPDPAVATATGGGPLPPWRDRGAGDPLSSCYPPPPTLKDEGGPSSSSALLFEGGASAAPQ